MASYGWKWSLLLFLDAVITVDVLTANNNDVKIGETRTVHFAWLLNRRHVLRELKKKRKKKQQQTYKFYHLFVPLKYLHVTKLLFQEY